MFFHLTLIFTLFYQDNLIEKIKNNANHLFLKIGI